MPEENDLRADVAIRLIEERERLGYSQRAFARELGITTNGLANYENGKSWVSSKCLAMAASLGLDIQFVLTGVRSQNSDEVEKKAEVQVNIEQATGVVGVVNGGVVNQHFNQKKITRIQAEVKPNDEHITEEQAFKLKTFVDEIVKLESKYKMKPKSYRAVWGSLNAHMRVTRYRLIPLDGFEKAEKYLRKWIGRLSSMKSAPQKNETEWRKKRYAYIKINTRNESHILTDYLLKHFTATSLKHLENDELERVYRYIAGRKSRRK